jgi:hypothetical protein
MTKAIDDIMHERARQISDEGWSAGHDDQHDDGELAAAAACYAFPIIIGRDDAPVAWPAEWDVTWWKPTTRRRDLVKAGALILAEIERLDRAAAQGGTDHAAD